MVALAFVIGAVISVVIGLVDNGISSQGATAIDAAGRADTRLSGGSADPNFLAAGIVPAVVLAAGLIASSRNLLLRVALVGALVVLVVGFSAAQSRGSLVASGIAAIAGLLFSGRGRLSVAAFIAFVVGVAAVSFALNPTAWHRITHINSEGAGRGDLWHVAWQMSEDHPAIGVGLNNFIDRSADYTRRPGELKFVDLIAERPHVVHNAYLQMFAETGVVGLSLFVLTLLGCFRCAWRAAKRFEAVQDSAMGILSRATLIAAIAGWSASFFLSNVTDPRMWVLLALPVALLAIARRESLVTPLERPAPPVVAAAA
jgi:O-antigen ligase